MQTFLPYADFTASLESLDDKRLGKQRVETSQILNVILGKPRKDGKPYKGWLNHPCSIMWRNHPNALKLYYNMSLAVWEDRGKVNNMPYEKINGKIDFPDWLGFEPFHASHRANLLRKAPEYYSKHNWTDNPEDPYMWLDAGKKWYKQIAGTPIKIWI